MSTKKYRLYNYLILLNHKDSIVTFFYRTISYSIYHNIRCPHHLRRPQSISAPSCLFPASFPVHIVKKRA
ncbi:hypothetical protein FFZ66_22500 [Salmonella enterica]|uniref:Uncharacterized protein n=6 Tax=Salmonella enterica I TaxID=59201 RepID=A0A725DGC8_SALEN|nr:hypothetical protein [Salmonella enterica subsp. enterica]EAC1148616.1 hypothetical protein [Salmonella enterica subsp. enterica serovar Typhimurium]EAM7671659.1 hypothetical protein [Salmonella enterica]EBQ9461245.1 hypothetical protein [Salmonella enterica subsp. enterica serovar Weltevreden]EBS2964726.1 hypothetical protein [Salmonella enterica subsp. enterica serovar Braenderup]EBW9058017.1 hypothetical protein [Salmonella enterica subsp. enterica serovar Enteritidis]EBX6027907.1 hypot